MRIALMILRVIFKFPYYLYKMGWLGRHSDDLAYNYAFLRKVTKEANKNGRVTIEVHGIEKLPEKDGFVLFPNHQGMFDMLAFIDSCPRPFAFVAKEELKNVPIVKQVLAALHSLLINRKDLKQSFKVINEMIERVSNGENFIIFAEGTRSKMGNKMLDMKGGSFKSAVKAKAPIIPCALVDAFKPFDEKSLKKLTVKVFYLDPIYYDEYKDMSTNEIAVMVKNRITEVLDKYVD